MFKVDGGSLDVIHCSLDGCETDTNPTQITAHFFKVNSGEVSCSKLSVMGLSFVGAKLIDTTSYTSFSVTDSEFASLTSDSTLISLKDSSDTTGAKQASISHSNFTTIACTGGDGGVVSAVLTTGQSLTLTSIVFIDITCSSATAKGGAVFASLDSSASLHIVSCTFKGCVATDTSSGSNSTGGGMRLMFLLSFSGKFSISSPVFDTPTTNNADYGKDLFISSYNLNQHIGTDSISFDYTVDTVKDRF
ncbi:hypothetical protein BLNAU_11027 [Blattamonas nauphoetae]|uniref:Uncharacterized protein n=1 Tax=Blattamonas nauphoetae TaxID=2049346 RepID=A0ABQ9XQL9_9EUKA|nr:hypothetical protein BLNAU_11027 [Blattamonas nauphoetae]